MLFSGYLVTSWPSWENNWKNTQEALGEGQVNLGYSKMFYQLQTLWIRKGMVERTMACFKTAFKNFSEPSCLISLRLWKKRKRRWAQNSWKGNVSLDGISILKSEGTAALHTSVSNVTKLAYRYPVRLTSEMFLPCSTCSLQPASEAVLS